MKTASEVKQSVLEKYDAIAQDTGRQPSGCGAAKNLCVSDNYAQAAGYVAAADLGLGCGFPLGAVQVKAGETILDLGSGAGNDAFIARTLVGEAGKVIGVDMSAAMVEKAGRNAAKLNLSNVEFRLGEIEALPIESNSIDVVISNCVLNLVPDKQAAFAELFRVLKPNGRFSISDIVHEGELPTETRRIAENQAGCVAGTINKADYLRLIEASGFAEVKITREKEIIAPKELSACSAKSEARQTETAAGRLISVTIYGEKLLSDE